MRECFALPYVNKQIRAKHDRRRFIGFYQRFAPVMLRPYKPMYTFEFFYSRRLSITSKTPVNNISNPCHSRLRGNPKNLWKTRDFRFKPLSFPPTRESKKFLENTRFSLFMLTTTKLMVDFATLIISPTSIYS